MPPEVALACRAVVKRYADVVAVDGLDLQVFRGECFGLLGPNGAGKTTTIEMLEGLLTPDAGEVEVLGQRWADAGAALRPRLGIQLQETQLADKLSVRETLRLFRSFYPSGRSVPNCSPSWGWNPRPRPGGQTSGGSGSARCLRARRQPRASFSSTSRCGVAFQLGRAGVPATAA
jgi:ABC-2 type transport system ATP-binding protein